MGKQETHTEATRQDGEEKYRRLKANIPGMVYEFVMHTDGTFSFPYVNDASRQLFDISPEDLMGDADRIIKLIHPDDRERFDTSVNRSAETLQPWRELLRHVVHGEVRWYDCMSRPERQPNGDILWDGIILEVTDRMKAVELLRKSQKELSDIISVSPVGIAIYDSNGQCISTNDSFARVIGATKQQVLEQNYNKIESWKKTGLLDLARTAVRTQSVKRQEVVTKSSFGKEVLLDCHLVPFGEKSLLFMSQDFSERKQWAEALSESEATLRSIYESSPMLMGVVELTEDDKIFHIYDNPATARFFNVPYQGTKHKTADELGAPSDAIHEWLVAYRQSQQQGKPVRFEYVHHAPDGPLWLSATVSVIGPGQIGRTRFSYVAEDITERKRTEEVLQQSEKQFKTLFMSISDGFYLSEILYDDNGKPCDYRYLEVNPKFEEILGLSRKQIIGKRYKELVPVDTTIWLDVYFSVARTGKPVTYEFYSKEYQMHFETYSYQPTKGQVSVFVRDITGRKESEEKLTQSERFLNNIIDQNPHPIWIADAQGTLIRINRACCDLLNIREEEVVGKYNILNDNIVFEQGYLPLVQSVFNEGKIGYFTITYDSSHLKQLKLNRSANVILDVTISPVKDESNIITNAIVMHRDVTEARNAEAALKQAKAYAEKLIESANAMIVVLDAKGHIRVINKTAEEITGYTRQELLGREWFEILVPKDKYPNVWEHFQKSAQDGLPGSFENPILTKAGEERFISWQNTELLENGAYSGSISYGIDITKRKQLEEQILQSQKMEAIGQLTGGIAHDFNNMLSVILGHAELLKSSLPLGDPLLKSVLEIENAGLHSRDITRQLLAFSRKQIIAPKTTNLNKLIVNIKKTLAKLIGENIDLRFLPQRDLWNVRIDPTQIDQILFNLAVNARDAMPDGGVLTIETSNVNLDEVYCTLHVECRPGHYVMLSVADDGVGMDKETLSHAFEPFYTTKEVGKGTGLGLATVYGIVRQNGGFVTAYSEPGKGTTFSIHIPRIVDKIEEEEVAEIAPPEFHPATVLLVEDDDMVRRMTGAILKKKSDTQLY